MSEWKERGGKKRTKAERTSHNCHAHFEGKEDSNHVFVLTAKTAGVFSKEWKHSEWMRQPQFERDNGCSVTGETVSTTNAVPNLPVSGRVLRNQVIYTKPVLSKAILPQHHLYRLSKWARILHSTLCPLAHLTLASRQSCKILFSFF